MRFTESTKGETESKEKKKNKAQETPNREERERLVEEKGPGATPADKARKQGHDESVAENENEERPPDQECETENEEGDPSSCLNPERRAILGLSGDKLKQRDGECGLCGLGMGECKGHEVSQSDNKKEEKSEQLVGAEKEEAREEESVARGETEEKEPKTEEHKEAETEKAKADEKEEREKGHTKEAEKEKKQCCPCRKGSGKCIRCVCATSGRKCLPTCSAKECRNQGDKKVGMMYPKGENCKAMSGKITSLNLRTQRHQIWWRNYSEFTPKH